MDLGYNISFTIGAIVINIVLILIVSINYSSTNIVNKRFRYFLIASLLMFLLNVATVITNANAKNLPDLFNQVFNGIYFFSSAIVSVSFFYYCASFALKGASTKVKRIFLIANLAGVAIYGIALIINHFNKWYFYFDYAEKFPYKHGWFFMPINLFSLV